MHILDSERTQLDLKLTNNLGQKTSTFHIKRPFQWYLSKNDQNVSQKLLAHTHYRWASKTLVWSFQKGHGGMSGSIYHPNLRNAIIDTVWPYFRKIGNPYNDEEWPRFNKGSPSDMMEVVKHSKIYFHSLSQGGRGQLQWVLFRGDVGPVGRLHHRVHGPLLHLTGKIRTTCDNDSSDGFLTSFWPQNCSRYLLPNFDWHVFGKIRTKIFF